MGAYIFCVHAGNTLSPSFPSHLPVYVTHTQAHAHSLPTIIELLLHLLEGNFILMKTLLSNLAFNHGDRALCLYLCSAAKPGGSSPLNEMK